MSITTKFEKKKKIKMARKFNIILASLFLVIFTIDAQTLIPENAAEVETWFSNVVKPIRYDTLFLKDVWFFLSFLLH